MEILRQGAKSSKKSGDLIFITEDKVSMRQENFLIDNFVPIYASRLSEFPSSIIYFDKCGIAEEKIDTFANVFCDIKKPYYDFLPSTGNKLVQICDFVSGIIAALLAFVNENDIPAINSIVSSFNLTQRQNLKLLLELMRKSTDKNKYFDHMSFNLEQGERIRYLFNYC